MNVGLFFGLIYQTFKRGQIVNAQVIGVSVQKKKRSNFLKYSLESKDSI